MYIKNHSGTLWCSCWPREYVQLCSIVISVLYYKYSYHRRAWIGTRIKDYGLDI